ncbi:hypothetical protein FRC06_000785 [Ceratobasidium sp. 370]|nr:hypothetical protein FRC06_000785 [Ceratobasidium sp. 370]
MLFTRSQNAIDAALGKVVAGLDTIRLSTRPLPESPDGLSDAQAAPAMYNRQDQKEFLVQRIDDLRAQIKRGPIIEPDFKAASAFADTLLHANTIGMDDRKMMLEYVLVALSRTKPGSVLQQKLQDAVITLLYGDLPHPPATFVGSQFRSPDGSGNNPAMPDLGKAKTPYARSVQSTRPIPPSSLPSPELIFDTLLKRDTPGGKPHPAGVSSLLFAFAVLIIHSLTSPESPLINDTSSYLDLSPLYGHDLAAQMKVRRNDGTGRLHEDVFAENRLLLMPPAVSALLVLFSRNHNYIVEKLYQVNENGIFKDPEELKKMSPVGSPTAHTFAHGHARYSSEGSAATEPSMVGSTFSVMSDTATAYTSPTASTFLGLGKAGVNTKIRGLNHQLVGRGQGNSCSVEFNLLYRWHATLSATDEKWTEQLMREQFEGKDPKTITWMEFAQKAKEDKLLPKIDDVRQWTFRDKHGKPLQRDSVTNRFKDADLANILHDAAEYLSGAFSARNTPEVMKIVEVMGIMQARKWGVCTLNEFRKFIGLKPYASFEEWNPREEIYEAARGLYGHPDNLELYVGMQAEEAKPVVDGAGLCPGYTISRAILADAVALTRGDRYLTTDYTPQNLTIWGFQDCQRDINNGAFGGILSKILMRNLPEHYTFNSVYALFPFLVPGQIKKHLTDMGIADQYDFERPKEAREVVGVNSYAAVREVLGDPKTYAVTYVENMNALTNGNGFFLAVDDPTRHQKDLSVMHKAIVTPEAIERYAKWYGAKTTELIQEKSFSMSKSQTRSVDIVRDVLNLVPVYWVSQELAGLPLKCKGNEDGLITEQEGYQMLALLFTYIFLNIDPLNGWQLRDKAMQVAKKLEGIIQGHLEAIASKSAFSIASIKAWFTNDLYGNDDAAQVFLTNLYKNRGDLTIEQLAYNVLSCAVASGANYSQAATQVVDFYLDNERRAEREAICKLALQETPENDRKLAGYVREAMRLRPQAPGIFRDVTKQVTLQDGENTLRLDEHDRLFVSLANSGLDPKAFPDPQKVDPDRPGDSYNLFGFGMHRCMGAQFTEQTMPAILRSIFKLKNVRRAPGASGKLQCFKQNLHGTQQTMYLSSKGTVTPWPGSMTIQIEGIVKASFMERGVLAGHVENTLFQRSVTLYTNDSSSSTSTTSYPFSMTLPTTGDDNENPLPPSFVQFLPGVSAEIRYRIRVDMSRSGLRRRESIAPEDESLKELHLTPKPIMKPSTKNKATASTEVQAKIALPCPLVAASGDRIPFVLTVQSQSPALAALYTNVTLQLIKHIRIKAYERNSSKETVISAGEVYDVEQRGDGIQILRGELGNGAPGRELSWTAGGLVEIKYILRLSIKPPPCTTALSSNIPVFEGTIPIRIMTHRHGPDMDVAAPALGIIGVDIV